MNKKIISVLQIINSDPNVFFKQLDEDIKKLQNIDQEVEVQYSTTNMNNEKTIVYSALIIGRK